MFNISTEFNLIDLRILAEISAPNRAFLSLYLSGPAGTAPLDNRIRTDRALLTDQPDELEYFDRNMKMVEDHLKGTLISPGAYVYSPVGYSISSRYTLCQFPCPICSGWTRHPLSPHFPDQPRGSVVIR